MLAVDVAHPRARAVVFVSLHTYVRMHVRHADSEPRIDRYAPCSAVMSLWKGRDGRSQLDFVPYPLPFIGCRLLPYSAGARTCLIPVEWSMFCDLLSETVALGTAGVLFMASSQVH